MTDKEKYVQELRDRIAAQRLKDQEQRAVFGATNDVQMLKQALKTMSSLQDPELYEKAKTLALDETQDIELRVLALNRLNDGRATQVLLEETALQILQNAQDQAKVRMAALSVLQADAFSSNQFSTSKAEFMSALRQVLTDENPDLRSRAAEQLAIEKDEFVQRKLIEEIQSGSPHIVNRAKAIQFLSYDLHAEHYPLLRTIIQEEKATITEKNEAILALSNDTNSKDVLEAVATDKAMPKTLRMSSANGLQAQDPYAFETIAKKIIVDDKEDEDMRILCLNSLMKQTNLGKLQNDAAFRDSLKRLKSARKSPKLKRLSRLYIDKTKPKKE